MTNAGTDLSEPVVAVSVCRRRAARGVGVIHLPVTCPRHADVVNAWIPIAGLAVVAVLLWVVVALER